MNLKMFEDFHLSEAILRAIRDEGYRQPTDIQRAAIPEILAGKDLMATAQTGTGKTAAFSLPMLDMLQRRQGHGIRALVLTPTRELALQIDASLRAYGRYVPLRTSVVLGGVSVNGQVNDLRKRPDILVATPGRLAGSISRVGRLRCHHDFLIPCLFVLFLSLGGAHSRLRLHSGAKPR